VTTTQPAPGTEQPSIGTLASDASRHLSTLVRGEIALAKAEIGTSVKRAGTGAGMFVAAFVLVAYSLTFGLIALAEGLVSLGVWRWLAYLIVFVLLLIVATVLVLIGRRMVKRITGPEKTIAEAKQTAETLRRTGQHTA
jgi:ABC-type multidrug transport system permease subunit